MHMVRSHHLQMDGYNVLFDDKLSTIFSAPNFNYNCNNLACILEIDDKENRFYNIFEVFFFFFSLVVFNLKLLKIGFSKK